MVHIIFLLFSDFFFLFGLMMELLSFSLPFHSIFHKIPPDRLYIMLSVCGERTGTSLQSLVGRQSRVLGANTCSTVFLAMVHEVHRIRANQLFPSMPAVGEGIRPLNGITDSLPEQV